jgi:23S rRNA (pseudouridine1915-N3)-methyltransferase
MKLFFWSIGKSHEPYVSDGISMFTQRRKHYYNVEWQIIPPLKNASNLSTVEVRQQEGANILALLNDEDFVVLLDERGKMHTSEALAELMQDCANSSKKKLIFIIGGAFGVSEEVMQRANKKWSLSQLVFPHQLVRLILAEQVYRACTIQRNEKYHHQ